MNSRSRASRSTKISSSARARTSRAASKPGPRAAGKTGTKTPARKAGARSAASKAAGKPASKPAGAGKVAPGKHGPRADLGAPIDGFFRKQPAPLRPILDELRTLIEEAAPDATSALKWGMPFFSIGDSMMCALGGHKSHVNLILSGPPGTYADPEGRLSGEGKTGRHLKLTSVDEIPRDSVRGWLRTAAELARRS